MRVHTILQDRATATRIKIAATLSVIAAVLMDGIVTATTLIPLHNAEGVPHLQVHPRVLRRVLRRVPRQVLRPVQHLQVAAAQLPQLTLLLPAKEVRLNKMAIVMLR